jgi:acyl transferase domain-containing protein
MLTTKKTSVRMLLEEAGRWHATAAHAPEKAEQMLREYRQRYKTDPAFRAEIDEGARQAREEAERRKRQVVRPPGEDHTRH